MKVYAFLLLSALTLLPGAADAVEFSLTNFSANIGYIEHFYRDDTEVSSIYAAYPELQVGGVFFNRVVRWSAFWGYWDDGVSKVFDNNRITYSFSSHIAGLRIIARPPVRRESWPLPVGLFAGISRHFISADNIGGVDSLGKTGKDFTDTSNTFEIGVNVEIPVADRWVFRGEVQQYVPFSGDAYKDIQTSRRVYKVGVGLNL